MEKKKLLVLEQKAIELKKKLIAVMDEIYEEDESFGDEVNEKINDESFMRSMKIRLNAWR